MTKMRLLKGNLEKKSVQNTLKKRGVRATVAGILVGSLSVTMMGCKSKDENEVATDNKATVEEKAEEKEETKVEEKKEEKKEEVKVEEKKEEVKQEVVEEKKSQASNVYIEPSAQTVTEGRVIVDRPAPSVTTTRIGGQVVPVVSQPVAKEEVKPSIPSVPSQPKVEEPKEEVKPSQPVVKEEEPKVEEPKVEEPKEEEPEVVTPAEEPKEEEVKPSLPEVIEPVLDIDSKGYSTTGYLNEQDITVDHIKGAEETYRDSLEEKGYVLDESLVIGSYREVLVVPAHKDNGTNVKELSEIQALLDKYKAKEFSVDIDRKGDLGECELRLLISYKPDMSDEDGDGYADSLDVKGGYDQEDLDYLVKRYRDVLGLQQYETVDHVEGKTQVGEVVFKANQNNGRKEAEITKLMDAIDLSKAKDISLKVVNGGNETIKVLVFGTEEVKEEPVVEERPFYVEGETPVNYFEEVDERFKQSLVKEGYSLIGFDQLNNWEYVDLTMYHDLGAKDEDIQAVIDAIEKLGVKEVAVGTHRKGLEDDTKVSIQIGYKVEEEPVVEEEEPAVETPVEEEVQEPVVTPVEEEKVEEPVEEQVVEQELTQDEAFADAVNKEIHRLVNEERAKVGSKPLTWSDEIEPYSTAKSLDMIKNNYFDHLDKQGRYTHHDMREDGMMFMNWAENIVMSYKRDVTATAQDLVNIWMNSDGHRENILDPVYTHTGIGIFVSENRVYGTQIFIR